ncbi:hypothetical protein COY44_00690, partial [Candidatus Berkelbacteria bacterium CG_4_10_14_0_8_um_filter_39_42]
MIVDLSTPKAKAISFCKQPPLTLFSIIFRCPKLNCLNLLVFSIAPIVLHLVAIRIGTHSIAAPDIRDRVVQHALVSIIQPLFEKQFIHDSYACRTNKGTHFAAIRLKRFLMATWCQYGKDTPVFVLQCDIRKFFQSISWDILLAIIEKTVRCPRTLNLVRTIVTTHQSATVP